MMFVAYLVVCFLASAANAQNVRLVDGNTLGEGRVEVLYNGEWGTVCDDFWELPDANVVCESLGLGAATEAFQSAFFGPGTGSIVLDDVSCSGDETSIFYCGNEGLGNNNCGHSEDAGVRCETGVRLVDGTVSSEGRVEVYYDGAWGTVCDDLWDDIDAGVVCRSLGFDSGTGVGSAEFGQGSGDILLDDVFCTGTETNLGDCSNAGLGVHNCAHFEDAGVRCSHTTDVRLVDGNTLEEGRVEVLYNGEWGTVCDDGWDLTDANVVCESLGLGAATDAFQSAFFGPGTGSIVLDDVSCSGDETSIFDCGNAGLGNHNCGHSEDAGVRCSQTTDVRLVDGNTLEEGRVEVLYNGEWGTVCDDGWDLTDANVVCESLGLGVATDAFQSAFFGPGTGSIVLDDVSCSGDETSIFDCVNRGLGIHNCGHSEDAGVRCSQTTELVRLVDGSDSSEGRVEVYYNGAWGTVCDDLWDDTDAGVVCRSLGFDTGTGVGSAEFGQGSGDILLDDVSCTGTETNLGDCSNAGIGVHNCGHSEDAGVRCSQTNLEVLVVRLVDGSDASEGRVEVYNNGDWGTVCDDLWDDTDAGVVCRSLGFGSGTAVGSAEFGQGSGDILLDDVSCTGTETNLGDCSNAGFGVHNCAHFEDAGVRCSTALEVRLVDGSDASEGRVEVYYNGAWGTVCDDFWDDTDAGVVCRSLGFDTGTGVGRAEFGPGSGDILLDDVSCTGTEANLGDCSNNGLGVNNCGHSEDAGVRCSQTSAEIRLVDGTCSGEGRVEIFYDGVWGTVCDDLWDDTDAGVVCSSLGYSSGTAVGSAGFGQGSGDIIFDNVECSPGDTALENCQSNPPFDHNCSHAEDAGVRCT